MSPDMGGEGEPLPPRDNLGCVMVALRAGGCMAILQILMAVAIALAALFSLVLFR